MSQNDQEEGILLTPTLLETLKTPHGGFTSATFRALDPDFKGKPSGWLQALMWTRITKRQLEEARAGMNIYSKQRIKMFKRRAMAAQQELL